MPGPKAGASGTPWPDLLAEFARSLGRPIRLGESAATPTLDPAPPGDAGSAPAGDTLLRGRPGLSGSARLGLYNRQYWFRLVSVMQADYSCAVHLMGLKAYNAFAMRYLAAHPPGSPFLADLDAAWPDFLAAEYQGPDREAVLEAVAYDRAFSRAFDAPPGLPLAVPEGGDLMGLALRLAPHVTALRLSFDFAAYRAECLADDSLEASIPLGPLASCLVVWRGADMRLWQKPVSPAAHKVLCELRAATTVPLAFARLEGGLTEAEEADLEANLAAWFREWVREGWLSPADPA